MENFNRVLSFVLGLVVVIVFVIVLSGRLHLGDRILPPKEQAKVTVTPTKSPTPTPKKKGFLSGLFGKATPTPTPVKKMVVPTSAPVNNYQTNQPIVVRPTNKQAQPTQAPQATKGGVPSSSEIPATGPSEIYLSLLGISSLAGIYLRKRK